MSKISVRNGHIYGVDFSNVDFGQAELISSDFRGCNFTGALLDRATIMNCHFSDNKGLDLYRSFGFKSGNYIEVGKY